MNFLLVLFSLFLVSCSTPVKLPEYKTVEHIVYPGKVKKVRVALPAKGTDHRLVCGDKELASIKDSGQLISYFSVDYKYLQNEKPALIPCFLKSKFGRKVVNFHIFNMRVREWDYPKSYINVAKKHVDLSKKDLARWKKEVKVLNAVYANSIKDKKLFTGEFQKPLKSKVTGVYGSRRVFNNKKDSWHSGTDFRARRPIPIPTSNDGVVAFAGDLFFNGNAVFIDHGMGVMTMYCHLSKIKVKQGDTIKKGTIIGLSGNTGRSSAPHLHWGVRVQNHWVDGLQFLQENKDLGLEANYQSTTSNQ